MDNQHCTFAELTTHVQRKRKVRAGSWFEATTLPAPLDIAPEPVIATWPSWVRLALFIMSISGAIAGICWAVGGMLAR